MFSAGTAANPNFAVAMPGHTNPTGLNPFGDTPETGMTTGDCWSMGLQGGAAVVSAIGQWASLGIQNRMQTNHVNSMIDLNNRQTEAQMDALAAKEHQMEVVASIKKKRQKDTRELAEAQSELKIAKRILEEEEAVREYAKVDVRALDRHFSRNDYFYGRAN